MEKLRMNPDEKNIIIEAVKSYLDKVDQYSDIRILGSDFKDLFTKDNVVKPTLIIPADVYTKMFMFVDLSNVEIGWHGLVKRDEENNIYTIYDILMFPQENTATHTTSEDEEYVEWMTDNILDPDFPINDLRLHGHSHVNMNVFSSATDDAFQKSMISKVEDGDYYIFMILNKKREICVFIYDFKQQVLFKNNDIDLIIPDYNGVDLLSECKTEYKKNCREPVTYYPGVKVTTKESYCKSNTVKKGKKHGSHKK